MNKLLQNIEARLEKDPSIRYFVACSGGIDSMVLLHALHKLDRNVSAIHVNYLLRGEDSENDQELVESVCKEYGIPCHVKRVDMKQLLKTEGGNLQETARRVRYRYFENFKLKDSIRIVLAHHADDQVETFLLNLARGGGIMGLSAMLPENKGYLRPLLPFTRDDIRKYAVQNNIKWREDRSNFENTYARNKLRNIILPELEKQFPQLRENILTLVNAFQQTQLTLESRITKLTRSIQTQGTLSYEEFDELDEFDIKELIRQLELAPGIDKELNKLRKSQPGKQIQLEHQHYGSIVHEREHFFFAIKSNPIQLPKIKMEIVNELPDQFDKSVLYLDPEKLSGKLQLRPWRVGDRIRPIGINGSKLISDILTDSKVSSHERSHQLVMTDGEKIVWCVGYSVSREVLAQPGTSIVKITLEYSE